MVANIVAWIVAVIALAALVLYVIGLYNTFVRLALANDQAFANIDSVLRQRHDEILKLVNACQAYMEHERGLLEDLTKLRTGIETSAGTEAKVRAENALTRGLDKLRMVWEGYPDLKASQNFQHVQGRMSSIETTLNDRREFFNASATEYNTYIGQFPPLIFAPVFGFRGRSLLETPEASRADISAPFPLKRQ